MQPNVGGADRVVRFLAGIAATAMIVTATFRVCPAYRPFGFSTCRTPKRGLAS